MENQRQQIDMAQILSPGSFRFGGEHFSKELQEKIIDASFNGGDTVHSQIAARVQELQQPQVPQVDPEVAQKLDRLQQMEKLVATPEFAKAYAQVLQSGSQAPIAPPHQQVQPAQTEQRNDPSTDPFAGLFSNETQVNETQNAAQTQPQAQANDSQAYEEVVGLCTKHGVDPTDFVGFMKELSADDLIGVYKAFRANPPQAQAQQQAPVQTEQQVPRSIQNVPVQNPQPSSASVFQPRPRNPLWD